MKCRYCGSDRHVAEILLPAWGKICRVCAAEKRVAVVKEDLAIWQTRYDEAVEALNKARFMDAMETAEQAAGREDARCVP
jgi:hypothetical protein